MGVLKGFFIQSLSTLHLQIHYPYCGEVLTMFEEGFGPFDFMQLIATYFLDVF